MRVAVVGAGVMGSATAWVLSCRGHDVTVFDQFAAGHQRGSSHGESRVIRKAYFEHPDYVPLLESAYLGWDDLESASGTEVFLRCGGLFLGRPDGMLVSGCLESAQRHDLAHEIWSTEEIGRQYRSFRPDADMVGFWDPDAGVIRADLARQTFVAQAESLGAKFHFSTTPNLSSFDRVVLTPGPWASRELASLNLPLRVTRQAVGWAPVVSDLPMPTWAVETPAGTYFYGFPELDNSGTAKLASHAKGQPFDPNDSDREPTTADAAELEPAFPYLPGLVPRVVKQQICLYTNTPDDHFIIDQHPEDPNCVFAVGFSGHGFKFAPVIGEILADLAEFGGTNHPIEFLRNTPERWNSLIA